MAHSLLADERRPARELSPIGTGDIDTLSRACGIPLRAYRADHVTARVARTIEREEVATAAELAALLRRCPEARSRFRRAVAISVTGRRRDPQQFDVLRKHVLPGLLDARPALRVWSAGCATGHELIDVAELIDAQGAPGRSRLLGSDLLEENIATARAGRRDAPIAARTRWEVRDLTDGSAPEGSFDLVVCRNVGIYFAPEARLLLMETLAGALAPGGVLLLGRSERLVAPERHGLAPCADHAYRRPR